VIGSGRVVVVGSVNIDLVASVRRHPQVGETVAGRSLRRVAGGKGANQAVAAARVGAAVSMLGKVGDDDVAVELRAFLEAERVDVSHVTRTDLPTGTAIVTVADDGENSVVVVSGANDRVTPSDVDRAPIGVGDVVLSQLEIPIAAIMAAFQRARRVGAATVLNAAPAVPIPRELLELSDVVVVNEIELATLLDRRVSPHDVGDAARDLRASPTQALIVTLGPNGAIAVLDGEVVEVPGRAVDAVDTTGAGDCFVGVLAARLAAGAAVDDAIAYSNAAASLCVQREGAAPSMPTTAEVDTVF
jgi:ribokinase